MSARDQMNADERFATLAVKVHLDAVESVKMSIYDMGAALPKEKADARLKVWQTILFPCP